MLPRSKIEQLIEILKKDLRRAVRMKVPGFPRPYYGSFLLRDTHWYNTWASSGSTYRKRADHTRNVYCDLRIGSYRYDQVTDGGLLDNDEESDSYQYVTVPIDDKCLDGLRIALWRLSEAKYREAVADFNHKQAARVSMVDTTRRFASFTKLKRRVHKRFERLQQIDEQYWAKFCKRASKWLSELPKVTGNWVEFDTTQTSKIFVNSEGSVIVQHQKVFTLMATFRHLTPEGSLIEQDVVLNCGSLNELPDMRTFKNMILEKHDRMIELIGARKMHAFSGPVLLAPKPAGVLFHEALGHRLEGSRLLSSGEGRTFKGQAGKKILNIPITVRDNPTLKKFGGQRCIGAYDFDDEGTPAQDTLLVENGVLREFLSTRAAITRRGFSSNGHARNKKAQRPISRMAVTIFEGNGETYSFDELKELLIEELKKSNKPYGLIVHDSCGGETETTSFDFQAFFGEISYATLVYKDGREAAVRGIDFVGTPLQALNNIIAIGNELEIDNSYCGAESGFLPITTISPAILLKNLELQSKEEELIQQHILPRPRLN